MKTYKLTISKTGTQIWFLILYPIMSLILFMGGLLVFGDFFEKANLILPAAVSFIAILLITSMLIVFRYISLPVTLTVEDDKFTVILAKRNMFYRFNKMVCGWDNIKDLSKNYDGNTKQHYISIAFKDPGTSYRISAKASQEKELNEAWDDINSSIKSHDVKAVPNVKITERGFYAGPWMRLLAYAGIGIILSFVIMLIYSPEFRGSTANILKLVAFTAFLIPFLINYFVGHKKQSENN